MGSQMLPPAVLITTVRNFSEIDYSQVISKMTAPITNGVRVSIGRNLALNAELHHDPLVLKRDVNAREDVNGRHISISLV